MENPRIVADCRQFVLDKEPFVFRPKDRTMFGVLNDQRIIRASLKGGNTYSPITYVVYSYGYHYPMYVYDYEACQWYGNAEKNSRTTNRHMKVIQPYSVAQWVDTSTLQRVADFGIVSTMTRKLAA